MKKILTVSLLALGVASGGSADAKHWYAGAGVGWLDTRQNVELNQIDIPVTGAGSIKQKSKTSDSAFQGTLLVGHTFSGRSFNYFGQLSGSWDNAKLKKTFNQVGGIGGAGEKTNLETKRKGTLALDFGASKAFKGTDVSLKLGVLVSKFETKIDSTLNGNRTPNTVSTYAWGVAPGLLVERQVGPVKVGLDYSYQMYETVKFNSADNASAINHDVRLKPRYHSVMLTVKKAF